MVKVVCRVLALKLGLIVALMLYWAVIVYPVEEAVENEIVSVATPLALIAADPRVVLVVAFRKVTVLPGASVRRLVFWRYLLMWHKPAAVATPWPQ